MNPGCVFTFVLLGECRTMSIYMLSRLSCNHMEARHLAMALEARQLALPQARLLRQAPALDLVARLLAAGRSMVCLVTLLKDAGPKVDDGLRHELCDVYKT